MPENVFPTYKIIFLGEPGVGKSALLDRITMDRFVPNPASHPGLRVERYVQEGNTPTEILFWDYSPALTLKDIPHVLLQGCHGYCLVIDAETKPLALMGKTRLLRRKLPGVPYIIVQNKVDTPLFRPKKVRGVDLMTSAKTGEGVQEALALLLSKIQR